VLLDARTGRLGVEAETFLYVAARAQLVAETIRPALLAGTHVVCERWTLSTEVYQGVAGGFGADDVRAVARRACGDVEPDRVIVLDVAVGGGLARLRRAKDRMESKGDAFHARVVRAYRRLAKGRAKCVLVPPGTEDATAKIVVEEALAVVG